MDNTVQVAKTLQGFGSLHDSKHILTFYGHEVVEETRDFYIVRLAAYWSMNHIHGFWHALCFGCEVMLHQFIPIQGQAHIERVL